MQYWNLNIRHDFFAKKSKSQTAASYWLEEKSQAPIFYSNLSLQDIETKSAKFTGWGNSRSEISNFFKIGSQSIDEQLKNTFVTIDEGFVWLYRPRGTIQEAIGEEHSAEFLGQQVIGVPKAIPIHILSRRHVRDVPLVLSSMKSNQWMSRGTFREIDAKRPGTYVGNIAAIQFALDDWQAGFKVDPLSCLSSLEFETLIAKLFEEHGCFVPAYKGGFLRDIDLLVQADRDLDIAGLKISSSRKCLSLQLKMEVSPQLLLADHVSYAIGLNSDESLHKFRKLDLKNTDRCFGRSWIRRALGESPQTLSWAERLLEWLPHQNRSTCLGSKD
jgi:hypothetical protein